MSLSVEPRHVKTDAGEEPSGPYVFLVGSPRSGTTMLKRMVSAHPEIVIARETHWIPRFYERRKSVDEHGFVKQKLVDKLFAHPRFEQMRVGRDELGAFVSARPELTYAELVSWVFARYAARKGKRLAGDKTPKYVRKLPTLLSLWPSARVVHLVRDGRDVCLSMLGWRMAHKAAGRFQTWRDDPVTTTALWWRALVGRGIEDGRRFAGPKGLELRYEDLVDEPERECERLAAHLGLPYNEAMPRYYEGKADGSGALSANAAWLPPTRGLRDWRTQMSPEDVARFELAAGGLLLELGYTLSGRQASVSDRWQVKEVHARFTAEAKSLGWKLPERWDVFQEKGAC